MKTLHPKSKRYEVQEYSETSLTWLPVEHTDEPEVALDKVQDLNRAGTKARVRDRLCGVIVITANQLVCTTENQT